MEAPLQGRTILGNVDTDRRFSADPEAVGLDPGRLSAAVDLATTYCRDGSDAGIAMFVARHGVPVVDVVVGTDDTGAPLTPDTRFLFASASKPLTAACIAVLEDRGLVSINDPVARYLPEFGDGDKALVTVRHLLTHTAGIPDALGRGVSIEDWYDWDHAVAATCRLPLEFPPGSRAEYHPLSYGLLGALIPALDGRDFATFCADEVATPVGMKTFSWGLPDAGVPSTRLGLPGQPDKDALDALHRPEAHAAVIPAINGWGTAHDLGAFYLAISSDGDWLSASIRTRLTRPHIDPAPEGANAARGLGFEVGIPPSGASVFGELAGPRTFGHPGLRSTVAWCDPDTDLVCVILANGARPADEGQRRLSVISDAIHRAVLPHTSPTV